MDTDEAQGRAGDIRRTVGSADDSLDCAESCESRADLIANLKEALSTVDEAASEIRELLSELTP